MNIDKIATCSACLRLEFVDKDGFCINCEPTSELIYATGMMTAATRNADEPKEAV